MLDIRRAVEFLERLPIRDLKTSRKVPFRLNVLQQKAVDKIVRHYDRHKNHPFRVIYLKSRRVGMSSLTDGLYYAHICSTGNVDDLIVAHENESSKALFRVPTDLHKANPFVDPDTAQTRVISVGHKEGGSKLRIATAGNVQGGRGSTVAGLHLSEAAFYPGMEPFTSLLNAVVNSPETMIVIESTANGMDGPGEAFYEHWSDAESANNDYLPVFLSWIDDPECIRDEAEAADAPQSDEERELMEVYRCDRRQIAWFRYILANQCHGTMDKMRAEYPWSPEVAFVATGDPAFDRDDHAAVRRTLSEPQCTGYIDKNAEGRPIFRESSGSKIKLYERPVPGMQYYLGADAAKGTEEGDFAALSTFAGTGEQACTYADRIRPDTFAHMLNLIGRYYNDAMINLEITGGWGDEAQRLLQSKYLYPNIYRWRGHRDDRVERKPGMAYGFTMSADSRRMVFGNFKSGLGSGELKIRDRAVAQQMLRATWGDNGRWEVVRGHDDELMAALLGWTARTQYWWGTAASLAAQKEPTVAKGAREEPEMPLVSLPDIHGRDVDGLYQAMQVDELRRLKIAEVQHKRERMLRGIR